MKNNIMRIFRVVFVSCVCFFLNGKIYGMNAKSIQLFSRLSQANSEIILSCYTEFLQATAKSVSEENFCKQWIDKIDRFVRESNIDKLRSVARKMIQNIDLRNIDFVQRNVNWSSFEELLSHISVDSDENIIKSHLYVLVGGIANSGEKNVGEVFVIINQSEEVIYAKKMALHLMSLLLLKDLAKLGIGEVIERGIGGTNRFEVTLVINEDVQPISQGMSSSAKWLIGGVVGAVLFGGGVLLGEKFMPWGNWIKRK
ncbi:MAG: hypothetical protein LBQ08_05115 [Holosporaceae bacterium]|jgi:hypothetical protein|nr:hypothetical protein [Holosporaceae bacterium]